ncbi:hypothetical protein [uncultured Paraglaciecola sp.]|mgnify:CR=1 FL=1|uniref:hypothetical protein n=1 Tax=uncultured Paraglaciecola sp. TaxID=1765024 RepID=UPI002615C3EB|nr:hypothetical protein [uncultured Paraglaciecola sp.]
MTNRFEVKGLDKGEIIRGELITSHADAINRNTVAVAAPRQIDGPGDDMSDDASAGAIGNETFACTVTESDIIATDSNSDTTTLKRVDTLSCVENTTGRIMTFNVTYPA